MTNDTFNREDYVIVAEVGVEKARYKRYMYYLCEIEMLLAKKKEIPAAWLLKLLSFYRNVGDIEHKYHEAKNKNKIDKITSQVVEFFTNSKLNGAYLFINENPNQQSERIYAPPEYYINGVAKSKKKRKINFPMPVLTYSLETLITDSITAYYIWQADSKSSSSEKDETIRFFYGSICRYTDRYFTAEDKVKFTEYKKKAMSAYLTERVGLRLFDTAKKGLKNVSSYYQASRNAFRPKKKKS